MKISIGFCAEPAPTSFSQTWDDCGFLASNASAFPGGTFSVPKTTPGWTAVRYGFLPKSPAGRTVVAGVFAEPAGFWEASGVGVAAGRLEFSFVMTESLKS
jgi:hypothetical protein